MLIEATQRLARRHVVIFVTLRDAVLHIEALLAYEIDFPEEDDGPQPRARATEAGVAVLGVLDRLLATLPQAVRAREGMQVVLDV